VKSFKELVAEAELELSTKSCETMELETAMRWAARAMARYIAFRKTGDVQHLLHAEDHRHEALEHGAMVGGSTLERVHGLLDTARSSCIANARSVP